MHHHTSGVIPWAGAIVGERGGRHDEWVSAPNKGNTSAHLNGKNRKNGRPPLHQPFRDWPPRFPLHADVSK